MAFAHEANLGPNAKVARMKYLITILLFAICHIGQAQQTVLTNDPTIAIPKVNFDEKGELKITASATSSSNDFDFLVGKWKMHNRHLNKRLENCQKWTEFESSDENTKILGDTADMDTYSTTEFPGQEGKNTGVLDPPVVGSFENGVGHFFCKDAFKGKPIIMMFRWDARNKDRPVWGQAFSPDEGKTWEWNFFNVSERIK